MNQKVRVFLATSLDGYIAGVDDDLSWLPAPADSDEDYGYTAHMEQVGALLMGRRTYDVVRGFGEWPYDKPVLVATHRPLTDAPADVAAVSGTIDLMIAKALELAAPRDVYLDGGDLVRHALDAGLVDVLTLTVVPELLGGGVRLFDDVARRSLQLRSSEAFSSGLVQLVYAPFGAS